MTASRALSIATADFRACDNVGKVLNSYVAVLSKSYMASTTAGSAEEASSEEQQVSQTLKNFAKFTLHGAAVVDHWTDPSDATLYALCRLDMAVVKETLAQAKEIDDKVRSYISANAEKTFDALSAKSSK